MYLYQIAGAVETTKRIIEDVRTLTPHGLSPVNCPDETLHEIITNAVLHRDYSIPADVQVRIFDDRPLCRFPGEKQRTSGSAGDHLENIGIGR
jgi:ATP-dependent DNA helicase RecG